MFGLTKRKDDTPSCNEFIAQIQEISRLKRDNHELYQFCVSACDEIFKHTGSHEWHDKLHGVLNKTPKQAV